MRKSFWFHLCSVLTLVAANCLFCAAGYAQTQTAYVTGVTVQGNPTDSAPVSVTISIYRSPDLDTYQIVVYCGPPLVFPQTSNHLNNCAPSFMPGVNTSTVMVSADPTKSAETVP